MMKAIEVKSPGAAFALVERPIPEPATGEVLIKVEACGICRGDSATKEARYPGVTLPRVPGHEVVGTVVKTGAAGGSFVVGQRVGVGWRGGYCRHCEACRRGEFGACISPLTTGQSMDGGYAEYMVAQEAATVVIPDGIDASEAAPLLCAGRTTFSALRNAGAGPGDLVAIQGIGGLGHLAIQYAARLGCRTVALSRGAGKEGLARKLGAGFYIDTATADAAAELQALGGARVLLCTAPDGKAASRLIDGLARNGRMVVVGSSNDPLTIPTRALVGQGIVVSGAGYATMDDALRFSMEAGVRPMIETFPLAEAAAGFEKMMNATVNFRAVLTM
jgi:D-arabinose 1-dehydrogenase-like Zn-dependent alcohol dehydrogenase